MMEAEIRIGTPDFEATNGTAVQLRFPGERAVVRPTHVEPATVWVIVAAGAWVDEQIASKTLIGRFRFAPGLERRYALHQKSWCPAISLRPSSPGVEGTIERC